MSFPKTAEEFEDIYDNSKRVEVNMTKNDDITPEGEGWEIYAHKVVTEDEEQIKYTMWYRIVKQ